MRISKTGTATWPAMVAAASLVDAWRRLRSAAKAASEVCGGRSEAWMDDSHAALTRHDESMRGIQVGAGVYGALSG